MINYELEAREVLDNVNVCFTDPVDPTEGNGYYEAMLAVLVEVFEEIEKDSYHRGVEDCKKLLEDKST